MPYSSWNGPARFSDCASIALPNRPSIEQAEANSSDSDLSRAGADLRETLSLYWFWIALGWNDTLQRYRGSLLGPFWITLTTAVFIVGLGPLYSQLFKLNMAEYLPFMAIGITAWGFITGTINDACNAFIGSGHMIKQVRMPRLVLIFRVVWRNIISFMHNIPIFILVFIFFGQNLNAHIFEIIPGFVIVCLNLVWISLVVAIFCARYRDIAPIVGSILQIGFFVTPVMWNYKTQNVSPWVVQINPFATLIELLRAPLLGESIKLNFFISSGVLLFTGGVISIILFARYRRQIVYWV